MATYEIYGGGRQKLVVLGNVSVIPVGSEKNYSESANLYFFADGRVELMYRKRRLYSTISGTDFIGHEVINARYLNIKSFYRCWNVLDRRVIIEKAGNP